MSPVHPEGPDAGATHPAAAPAALSAEQTAALETASAELRTLLRPARVATVNGWTIGVFGVLSILWGLLSGAWGVIVGAALVAVAWNELRGRNRLRALDPEGARILGWNQWILAGVVALYCAATIVRARTAPSASTLQLEELAGVRPGLVAELTTLAYGIVALAVAAVQAFLARWHFGREAAMRAFRERTPTWILELLARVGTASG